MSSNGMDAGTNIIKEGYLMKRGEFIKNWRNRYFYLLSDGTLIGYKSKPEDGPHFSCYNVFDITDCKVMATEVPKSNSFLLRCFYYTKYIDRLFRCENKKDRDEWVDKIKTFRKKPENSPIRVEVVKENDNLSIGPYKMLKLLGEGNFGKVLLSEHVEEKKFVAIKVMKKENIYENEEVAHIESEGRILKSFNHPFLISMVDFFQTKERIYFVMEFFNGGELYYHLRLSGHFTENRTRLYAAEVILALQFLHYNKITYRDLKLENTILDGRGHVRLCDFGLCKENTNHNDQLLTFCGTREYIAPEIILENALGYSVDWWCLGVFIFECLTSELPFSNSKIDDEALYDNILTAQADVHKYDMANDFKQLILKLLIKDPKKRYGCGEHDGEEIKNDLTFANYDWEDVYNKKITPEFVPDLAGPDDTRFFNKRTLNTPIVFSPPRKNIDYQLDI